MTAPLNLTFPQADAIIEQLTTRVHQLIGTDYRDAAIDAASRAEAARDEVNLVVEDTAGAIREHVKDDADRADRSATKAAEHEAGAGRAAAEATKAEVDKLVAGAPEAFDTLKEISDELEKNETERAALATTIGKKADTDYVDGQLASSTRSGISLLPMVPGTNTPMWAASYRKVTDDVPPGEKVAYANNEDGSSISMEWEDGWAKVVQGVRYRVRVWLKADKPGSAITFWGYGDNDTRGITNSKPPISISANYPVWVRPVPTEWTLYEGSFDIREGVSAFRIGGITWNHAGGETTDAVQMVSGLEIWPDFASGEHAHTSADIADGTSFLESEDANLVVKTGTDGHIHAGNHPTGYNHLTRKGYVDGQVSKKADTTYVDQELSGKATKSEVSKKADTTYVDQELSKKATKSEVSKKADTTYVDQELSKKATKSEVAKKADTDHTHSTDQIDNLDALIDQRAGVLVREAPKMHVWDGEGVWVAPAGAGPNDSVLNTDTGEIHSVEDING